ncbi:MAG: RNA methyltransferase [Cyanobacteria bacterium]|nr:RNA methyltransferase [Cyanobacteriota bacterium]
MIPNIIESPSNPLIKEMAGLKLAAVRKETGLILVEGKHPIEEACRQNLEILHFFQLAGSAEPSQSLEIAALSNMAVEVSEKVMSKLSTTESPPPCVGIFKRPEAITLENLLKQPFQGCGPLFLGLDTLQDPSNLGGIVRSAAAFSVSALFLTGNTVDVYNPKVIRGSAGLIFSLPVLQASAGTLLEEVIHYFDLPKEPSTLSGSALTNQGGHPNRQSFQCFVTTSHERVGGAQRIPLPYRSVNYSSPCLIYLGNEGNGVSFELLNDPLVTPITIEMAAGVESLNVTVAGAIILAEAFAQRQLTQNKMGLL